MPQPINSIKSYFQVNSPFSSSPIRFSSPCSKLGDGFTEEERRIAQPDSTPGHEAKAYNTCTIAALKAGPQRVLFTGRVVNAFEQATGSKRPNAAKGCLKVTVCDGTGQIVVKIWYSSATYPITISTLVTVYTTHISPHSPDAPSSSSSGSQTRSAPGRGALSQSGPVGGEAYPPLFASVYPERDRGCHVCVHPESMSTEGSPPTPSPGANNLGNDDSALVPETRQYRTPTGYIPNDDPLPGLVSLHHLLSGGHEIPGARVLAYVARISVQPPRSAPSSSPPPLLPPHSNMTADNSLPAHGRILLHLSDSSLPPDTTVPLALYPPSSHCLPRLTPHRTTLLLAAAGLRASPRPVLSLTSASTLHLDPHAPPLAPALARLAARRAALAHPNPPFPPRLEALRAGPRPATRYTLASLSAALRALPGPEDGDRDAKRPNPLTGRLALVPTGCTLLRPRRRNMLFCGARACCGGEAVYSSSSSTSSPDPPPSPATTTRTCELCLRPLRLDGDSLRLAPAALGALADETGAVTPGQGIVFSDAAWGELLGCAAGALAGMADAEVRAAEGRVVGRRVAVDFVWLWGDGGGEEGEVEAAGSRRWGRIYVYRVVV